MTDSTILGITYLASGEVIPYATVNAMLDGLEEAANDFLSVDLSAGNVTLTDAQYRGYVLFRASGNTVARNLTVPAIKRLVVIDNTNGTAVLSIIVGATTLTLSAGEKAIYYTDGTTDGLIRVGGVDITSFTADASPDGSADYVLTYDSSAGAHKKVLIENLPFSGGGSTTAGEDKNPLAVLSDRQTSGTAGGTFTSGAWQTRAINTEEYDADGIVSISANQFTLQAGTYRIIATAPAVGVDKHKARLRNVTDGTTTLLGTSQYSASASTYAATESRIDNVFTIASAKTFEIQHQGQTTRATSGFGVPSSLSVDEIYTVVCIIKLSDYNHQFSVGRLTIDFASDANYTLVTTAGSEEWKDKFMTFTDTGVVLTAGRDVIFPNANGPEYIVKNSTAQTITCKRSGQTGVAITTGSTARIYHDGTDMVSGP